MLRKNTAGQFLYFAGVNATTGAALTGATFSYRRGIDGTFAAGGGTITEDTGTGFYKCALAQADTNGNDLAFFFTATNAVPVCINALTTAADPSDTVRFGLTALPNVASGSAGAVITSGTGTAQLSVASGLVTLAGVTHTGAVIPTVTTLTGHTAQTGDAYARLGAPAGASVSADIAAVKAETAAIVDDTGTSGVVVAAGSKSGYSLTATTGLGNQTADITGSLSGSVGSVTGAVGSVTGNVGGNVVGSVGSVTGAVGSVTGLTASDVGAIKAKTDSLTYTVAGVLDANVQRINDVVITGDGQVGTEFGV